MNATWNLKRWLCLLAAVVLLVALAACESGEEVQTPPTTEAPTEPPFVSIGDREVDRNTTQLDLTGGVDMDALLAAAEELEAVTKIELGQTELSVGEIAALREAFPNAQVRYSVSLFGGSVSSDTETLELPDMDPARSEELAQVLPLLPELTTVNFVSAEGVCAYTIEDIPMLDVVKAAAPEVDFRVSFELFGQTVTSGDTEIRYVDAEIGNEGVELFYQVLPHLTGCEYLLLDECGIDNVRLAQLRDAFPEVNVVWRIWLGSRYTVLTDVKKILASSDSEPKLEGLDTADLQYCRDVIYLDLGHNRIPDISFVEHMPNLEVAILAINYWRDATPLASCTKLEYLEIFSTSVTDISPLAGLTNLRHLNICNLKITDATPLYGLTNLERLWVGCTTSLSRSSLAALREQLPNCEINTTTAAPTAEGWRVHPRYDLLREQMGYAERDYCFWWDDEKFKK